MLGKHLVLVLFGRPSHSRPAMAGGIYSANLWKCAVVGLDSRFRGNDWRLEWIPIPIGTSTKHFIILVIDLEFDVVQVEVGEDLVLLEADLSCRSAAFCRP